MNQVELDAGEIKEVLTYTVDNNRHIQEKGLTPIATEIIGDSGLGKTSISLQLAKELGMNHVKLNLAQLEELGDLIGYPGRQFELIKPGGTTETVIRKLVPQADGTKKLVEEKVAGTVQKIWIDELAVSEYTKLGYTFTGQKRMSYSPPEWIAGKTGGGFLILDDWNRADIRFIQAVMELVDRQEYISWKLPKDWHIILTANPDNGEYLVNAIDNAQKTRFMSITMKWSVERWGEWAEKNGIDNRCINFMLMHGSEVVKGNVNPRSLTNFFNSISSMKNFEDRLALIQNLGEGSVGPEVATMFSVFIANRMDQWIHPKEILMSPDEKHVITVLNEMFTQGTEEDPNEYRADIASVLGARLINFALYHAENNPITPEIIDRITNIIKAKDLFTDDLNYHIVKKLLAGNKNKFKLLVKDSEMQELATK